MCYVGIAVIEIFDENVRKDLNDIGWNPFNSDGNHIEITDSLRKYVTYNVGTTIVEENYNYDNDSLGRLNNIQLVIGSISLKKTYNYDDNDVDSTKGTATLRIGEIKYYTNTGSGDILQYSYNYTYDLKNIITKIQIYEGGTILRDQYNYTYDGFNQLIREDILIGNGTIDVFSSTCTYTYNNQGNRTSKSEYTYTIGSLSGLTPVLTTTYAYDDKWKDQLVGKTTV